jgi:nitrate reductase molybdenum cofactor assembly chaperone NarJ/NarW
MTRAVPDQRAVIYKLCSLALQYPDEQILRDREALTAAVMSLAHDRASAQLRSFFAWFGSASPLALAQEYVKTFDLAKRSTLYLTFYSLGDRRDRGLALLRLKRLYRAAGLPLRDDELPDFLPVMLEFASAAARGQGEVVLREHRPALELIRLSLHAERSPYSAVLDAVCEQVGTMSAGQRLSLDRLLAQGPPRELVGLEPFAPPEVMPAGGRP